MKTLLVQRTIECPHCGHHLSIGDVMYQDDQSKTLCGYCKDEYLENVMLAEGENGIKLK